ncbi:hypothetical protein BDV12DRAFT_24114 [Aspergillus spectabilis]
MSSLLVNLADSQSMAFPPLFLLQRISLWPIAVQKRCFSLLFAIWSPAVILTLSLRVFRVCRI